MLNNTLYLQPETGKKPPIPPRPDFYDSANPFHSLRHLSIPDSGSFPAFSILKHSLQRADRLLLSPSLLQDPDFNPVLLEILPSRTLHLRTRACQFAHDLRPKATTGQAGHAHLQG